MKPTPEMIEAAELAIDALDYANMPVGDIHREIARAALSAALSVPAAAVVGEPVAWLHPTANWSDVDRQKVLNHCVKDGDMPVPLYSAPSAPDGWKLVPIEPTVEMLGAAADYSMRQNNAVCGDGYYRVMVAAAPPQRSLEANHE